MVRILVISVEGEHSNTEVNFYNGVGYHIRNSNISLSAHAIGMQSKDSKSQERIISHIKSMVRKSKIDSLDKTDKLFIFFVGDGDKKEALEPMKRAIESFKKYFKENGKFWLKCDYEIQDELIYDEGLGFEKSFERILDAEFNSVKTESNKNLFKDFAEKVKWLDEEGYLEMCKIYGDLESIQTKHINIFERIK